MQREIELTLESVDGLVDCRLERNKDENGTYYMATILYPHMTDGIAMSKVYEHKLVADRQTGRFGFADDDGPAVHPKVRLLEGQLADAISVHNK